MKHQSPLFRCDGINRRDFLHAGLMTGLGLNMADLIRCKALASDLPQGKPTKAKAKSCILIWLDGGPSHLETFDLKPDAPVEIRGEFKPIKTDVPGIEICEHLPKTAKVMKHVSLIRSLTHAFGNHNTGSHYLLTGNKPSPVVEYPSMGSIYAQQIGGGNVLPPYVAVPDGVTYSGSGFLPATYQPFSLGGDPSKSDFRVRNLNPPASLSFERVQRRREMQQYLDDVKRSTEENPVHTPVDTYYEQAYALLTSPESQAAFNLSNEPGKARERYGRSRIGTGCLMARRMVEHGVGFVTVVDKGWDMHQQIFKNMPDALFRGSGKLPALDLAYSGLISDLHERGLLDSTLVILMGEFGRTPKINDRAGRDHWPRSGFVCMAGGGVRGGQVIGSTDAFGESPSEQPVAPEDLASSTLSLLGIRPDDAYLAPNGRPIQWVKGGRIIEGLT
ncbi:MAG: DUF1501 domain-containing protein [Verrucomicrobia bacterium]|nr:DUF1501 domain-containing protein [Verrucomicrobiota bacterium]